MRSLPARGLPQAGKPAVNPNPATNLGPNYQPSQPHGWPAAGPDQEVGTTIGGHTPAKDFTYNGRSYRIGLLPFGQPGDSPDPVYENVPTDPTINFKLCHERGGELICR
jgi:hypothetical protein